MTSKKEAADAVQTAAAEQAADAPVEEQAAPGEGEVPADDGDNSPDDSTLDEVVEEVEEIVEEVIEEVLPAHGSHDAASRGLHTDASGSYTPPKLQSYEG